MSVLVDRGRVSLTWDDVAAWVEPVEADGRREGAILGGIADIARRAGLPRATVQKWSERGRVPLAHADRLAVLGLGVHPALVWGEDWWLTVELDR